MDYLPQNPVILVASINMLLRDAERSPIELGQAASNGTHSNLSTIGFALGFVLMMVLDVVMG